MFGEATNTKEMKSKKVQEQLSTDKNEMRRKKKWKGILACKMHGIIDINSGIVSCAPSSN